MTFLEIRHQAAGHPGQLADCAKCAETDPSRPAVRRRARAAARRRTAAVRSMTDRHAL
jgi:hypothetical protein